MASLKEQSEELFNLGLQYSENGQFEDAIKCYDKVINLTIDKRPIFSSSSPFPSREDMAELKEFLEKEMKEREKERKEREKELEKELELNPNLVMAYFNRGKCKQELEDYKSALSDYREAINLNKKLAMAYVASGKCQQELKDYDSALSDYDEAIRLANDSGAIELNFDFSDIYYNIGICCEEYEEEYSLPSCEYELYGWKYSYREPSELSNLDMLYQVKYHNSRCEMLERAVAEYSKAIELTPSFADAYNKRGNCYIKLDRLKYHHIELNRELVLSDYNEAIKLNPSYAEAYNNRGIYYQYLGEYKRALDDYDKAIELNPNYIEAYLNRGACYASMSDEELTTLPDIEPFLFSKDIFISNYFREISNVLSSLSKRTEESCIYAISLVAQKQYDYAKLAMKNVFNSKEKHHEAVYLKNIKNAEELDIKNQDLEKLNTELEEKNKQLELEIQEKEAAQKQVEEKNKELNNLIAMFAHNFLGTLQCIRSNAEHDNNAKIHLKTVKMMSGALTAFSIISADDDKLIEQLKQDNKGEINLQQNLANNLALAISQLLSQTNKDKIINIYLNYLQKTAQIKPETNGEDLRFNDDDWEKWQALQHQWEDEFNRSFSETVDLSCLKIWIETNFFPIQIIGFNDYNIRFKEFGITDSIFLVIFMEILVNALKYSDVSQNQPLTIMLCKQDQHYQLTCENPSAHETNRGSHKGTDFLKSIAHKVNGQFITESTEQSFKSTFIIPAELLE